MRFLIVVGLAIASSSCTHMNVYEEADAALLPVPCDFQPAIAADGMSYTAISVTIIEVDGNFTGSGQGCKDGYVYRIKPGERRLKLVANFLRSDGEVIKFGFVSMTGQLKARNTYKLLSQFDGNAIAATVLDNRTEETVATGRTDEIRTQSGRRQFIFPILVK